MDKLKKIGEIRNWIGKFFLLALGMLLMAAVFYRDLKEFFMLVEPTDYKWTDRHYIMLFSGGAFVIGGVFLNNILDGASSWFKNWANKLSK